MSLYTTAPDALQLSAVPRYGGVRSLFQIKEYS